MQVVTSCRVRRIVRGNQQIYNEIHHYWIGKIELAPHILASLGVVHELSEDIANNRRIRAGRVASNPLIRAVDDIH